MTLIEDVLHKELNTILKVDETLFEKEDVISYYLGYPGISLFLVEYALKFKEDWLLDHVVNHFEVCLKHLNTFTYHPGFGGMTGTAWVMKVLNKQNILECDSIISDLSPFIHQALNFDISSENYDPITGIIGKCRFFIEDLEDNKNYKSLLKSINCIYESKIVTNEGYTWDDKQGSQFLKEDLKAKYVYNPTLSHGVASIIDFLSVVYELGIERSRVKDLLEKSTNWLLSQSVEDDFVSFPRKISDVKEPQNETTKKVFSYYEAGKHYSPLTYALGNIGIAASLLNASKSLSDNNLYNISVNIAKNESKKDYNNAYIATSKNGEIDIGFCNGTAGCIFIYDYFFKTTGNSIFKRTRENWIKLSLGSYKNKNAFLVPGPVLINNKIEWIENFSLLNGTAGFLLTLIEVTYGSSLKWFTPLINKI